MKPLVLNFEEIASIHKNLVGGKAFSLSQLVKENFKVPPGFVLTSAFFDKYINDNNLKGDLNEIIVESFRLAREFSILKRKCKEIKEKILNGEFSEKLMNEINQKIKDLQLNKVAVRSSATLEDTLKFSFAGQFDTFLNVNVEDIPIFVKKCFASLFNENVILYSLLHKIPMHDLKMAVIIQQMIDANKAGVIFTKDIEKKDKNFIVIEVAKGLGESVVSGTAKPEKIRISKKEMRIVNSTILSEKEIYGLLAISIRIEKFYKVPVDIEWAIKGDEIFVLQARPITV